MKQSTRIKGNSSRCPSISSDCSFYAGQTHDRRQPWRLLDAENSLLEKRERPTGGEVTRLGQAPSKRDLINVCMDIWISGRSCPEFGEI